MTIELSNIRAVAVVGGVGKRLRPFTIKRPKALLQVGIEKRPMLEFTMMPWVKNGIKDYVFCTGYKGEMIEGYFGSGSKFGARIEYSRETNNLETGGAIKNAIDNKKLTTENPVIIFYCDDIVRLNVKKIIDSHIRGVKEFGFKASVVATNKFRAHYGVLDVKTMKDGTKQVMDFEEKPLIEKHANVGIYFLEPEVLEMIEKQKLPFKFERVIIPELVRKEWLMLHEISYEDWLPINTDKEYESILNLNLTDFYSKVL
jgi:NDP-sugar pyrophosphorylase family protein